MLSTGGPINRWCLPHGIVGYSFSPQSFTIVPFLRLLSSVPFRFTCFTGALEFPPISVCILLTCSHPGSQDALPRSGIILIFKEFLVPLLENGIEESWSGH